MKQTRLAYRLRAAAKKIADDDKRGRLLYAADRLDFAAASLGASGERVKQMAAYAQARRLYEEATGEPYDG